MALQSGSIRLQQDVPPKITYPDSHYTTTSDGSLNRRHTRIAPRNDVDFQPNGTREIEFIISSATSFIDFENMYLTGFLLNRTTHKNIGASGNPGNDTDYANIALISYLEKGGINSLFETVTLENASTGAVIDRIENYNTWCATMAPIWESDHDGNEIYAAELDSSQPSLTFGGTGSCVETVERYTYTITEHNTAKAKLVWGANYIGMLYEDSDIQNTRALAGFLNLKAGDTVMGLGTANTFLPLQTPNATRTVACVLQKSLYRIIIFGDLGSEPSTFGAVDWLAPVATTLADPVEFEFTYKSGNGNINAKVGSSCALDGTGDESLLSTNSNRGEAIRFTWKPRLPFLKRKKYYPLFLHASGLRLRCTLDPNVFHSFFMTGQTRFRSLLSDYKADLAYNYQISKVRLNLPVYDFHSSINKQYLEAYKSTKGLLWPFRAVWYGGDTMTTSAGNQSKSMNVGVRSARCVISRMTTDKIYSVNGPMSQFNPCLSTHPALGLGKYQYSSGSLVFPQREIELDDNHLLENRKHLWIQTMKHCSKFGVAFDGADPQNAPAGMLAKPSSHDLTNVALLYNVGTNVRNHYDAKNMLMNAILGREMEGRFSGLDLSIQPLKLDMVFDNSIVSDIGTQRLLHTFIEYDKYLHQNESGGNTVLY